MPTNTVKGKILLYADTPPPPPPHVIFFAKFHSTTPKGGYPSSLSHEDRRE